MRHLIEQRWREYAAVLPEAEKRDGGRERAFYLGVYEAVQILREFGRDDREASEAVCEECEAFFLNLIRSN